PPDAAAPRERAGAARRHRRARQGSVRSAGAYRARRVGSRYEPRRGQRGLPSRRGRRPRPRADGSHRGFPGRNRHPPRAGAQSPLVGSWLGPPGSLPPPRRRCVPAVACMLGYAAASGPPLGLISPFTQVLFGGAAKAASPAAAALPTVRWPVFLQKGLLPWLTGGSAHESLTRITAALVIAFILKNVFDYLQQYLMVWVEQAMVRDLR